MKPVLIGASVLLGLAVLKLAWKYIWLKFFAVKEAYRFSRYHKVKFLEGKICGCFTCLHIFSAAEIVEWTDNGLTAVCPYCGTNTVLSDSLGFPITEEFLGRMRDENIEDAYEELESLKGQVIADQHDEEIAPLPYGKTCVGTAGCGPISIYNVLILLGRSASLYEILRTFEKNKYIIFHGKFGTNPHILGRALKKYQLDYEFYMQEDVMEAHMKKDDLAILAIWNNRNNPLEGAHFFTVQKLETGYDTYNAGRVKNKQTLKDIIANGKLIKGYRIIDDNRGE